MRIIPPALAASFLQQVQTLALCLRLARKDGTVLGFTNHDKPISLDAQTYKPIPGMTPSQVAIKSGLSVDNSDYSALIDHETLTVEDLLWGVFDGAYLQVFLTDWTAPENGSVVIQAGYFGEISMPDNQLQGEIRSTTQRLQSRIGRIVMPDCDVPVFAEGRCPADRQTWTDSVTITAVADPRRVFTTDSGRPADHYRFGELRFLNGANAQRTYAVAKHQDGGVIHLFARLAADVQIGDDVQIVAGCDRRAATCKSFGVFNGFQGFPFVPGRDSTYETPPIR